MSENSPDPTDFKNLRSSLAARPAVRVGRPPQRPVPINPERFESPGDDEIREADSDDPISEISGVSGADKVRSLAPRLNALTNEANQLIEAVEKFLNDECRVGVTGFVKVSQNHTDSGQNLVQFLGYARVNGKFRIVIRYTSQATIEVKVRPWVESNRNEKLETIEKLPELITLISKTLSASIERAEGALKQVANLVQSLGIEIPRS